MEKFRDYDINFSSLKLGKHSFEFLITQSFFDLFDFDQEFSEPNVKIDVFINKHSNFLELEVFIDGKVDLKCDVSDEKFSQEINNKINILVKFGEEFDDSNQEVLIIPYGAYCVNIAQFIYEGVILAIPLKHIHPRYLDASYKDKYIDLIEKYAVKKEEDI